MSPAAVECRYNVRTSDVFTTSHYQSNREHSTKIYQLLNTEEDYDAIFQRRANRSRVEGEDQGGSQKRGERYAYSNTTTCTSVTVTSKLILELRWRQRQMVRLESG